MGEVLSIVSVALLAAASGGVGADTGKAVTGPPGVRPPLEVTAKASRSIERGLDFLVAQQDKDGSFAVQGGRHRAAITGLAGLALLSAGHTPGRGKHAREVERAVRYVLKTQDPEGCYASPGGRTMHGHGYALHFLAEAYGMIADRELCAELRSSIERGVRLTCASQSKSGGWWYQPASTSQHEGSITVTQVQALWAARQAGFEVPQKTIDMGCTYMRRSQMGDGGIAYALNRKSMGSRPAISVAGVMVFCALGLRDCREGQRALGYMRRMLAGGARARNGAVDRFNRMDPYTVMYLAQALHQAGDPDWSRHYPGLRSAIVAAQEENGGWKGSRGAAYASACYVLALTVPCQYLPSFQR